MKNEIVLMMLLFPAWAFCQVEGDALSSRFSIGARYSPDLSYRQLDYSQKNDGVEADRNAEELPKLAFTAGLNFRYRLNNKLAIETGLLYADKGFKTKEKVLSWVSPSSQFPAKSETEFQFSYIEIPLRLIYIVHSSRLCYYVSAGFIVSSFLAKRTVVKLEYPGGNSAKMGSTQELGYNKFSLSANVGFGLTYQLSKRFSFDIEPAYRHGITSITGDKKASEYLYSLGLSTSVFYTFKKRSL